ncbi:MAG: preprotein translocase subunit SecG [Candidatus Omnitrophica bacterium]|nr:preprotein translocase subunit SecG [Candidatus Omnitrophota bacterium]
MTTLLIVIHVTACVVLIVLVLIQRGRGAGLVSFAGVESMFGTKTSVFLTRTTTIMSIVFFITCLALAVLSVKQSKSLMRDISPATTKAAAKVEPVKAETVKDQAVAAVPAEKADKVSTDAAKAQ